MRLFPLQLSLLLLLFSTPAFSFTALVVSVKDGDTIEVLSHGRATRIRLHGIDCPEKRQAYGYRAKIATAALTFGRTVTIHPYDTDKYGRTVADVTLSDETNVNHLLVKDGWCWWYRKYAPDDPILEALEAEARHTKRGLWIDHNPVPPWVYRKLKHKQSAGVLEQQP
ncbi:MAG: thermonuclease family protein [Nitrospira sp.]|nr:thermonuclease family protein [Nitrospira sp.]